MNIKYYIKKILPPLIVDIYHYLLTKKNSNTNNEYEGVYNSWSEAKQSSTGYDAELILNKTKQAILKVKQGEVAYERDSVTFDHIEYSWPLLSTILKVSLEHNSTLSLIDLGGALGSSYYQNLNFLSDIKDVNWNVVEQSHYVEWGNQNIKDSSLKFYDNLNKAILENNPSVLLASSFFQYIESPEQIIDEIIGHQISYIIIDRTAFIKHDNDIITVQHVPQNIYQCSYPIRFLNEKTFLDRFTSSYNVIAEFKSYCDNPFTWNNKEIYFKGYILKLKKDKL